MEITYRENENFYVPNLLMPEEEPADDAKPEQDDSADDAEKTIPISSGDED